MLSILNNFKLDYLIIGGVAVNIHGHLRYTKDLDIFVDESKTEDLLNVWVEFFGCELKITAEDIYSKNAWLFGNAPNRIDFLIRTEGVTFKDCFNNKLTTHYKNIPFYVISKPDLIKNKIAVGRKQDLYDAEKLSLIK